MLTLLQAQNLSLDSLLKGIIEVIVTESEILGKLPFKTIVGNSLKYNRESTLPTAGFYAVGDTWTESTHTVTQVSSSLTILGGDADVDDFEKQTLSNINDQEAIAISSKSKALARKWDDTFIYGNATTDPKQFNGMHALMPSGQMLHQGSGSTGAALSLANLDKLIDLVMPGKPDALVMNRTMRRRIGGYYRGNAGSPQTRGQEAIPTENYGGIPILIDDWITMTETISSAAYSAQTGGATTSIFAVKFGEDDKGVTGLQNGSIQKQRLGELETKDAVRWRLKWYCGLALFSTLAIARLDGITDSVVVV